VHYTRLYRRECLHHHQSDPQIPRWRSGLGIAAADDQTIGKELVKYGIFFKKWERIVKFLEITICKSLGKLVK
jgi:hypothetical protein